MSLERLRARVEAQRRLRELLSFRSCEGLLEAAKDWLDKEIYDIENFLRSKSQIPINAKMTTFRDAAI